MKKFLLLTVIMLAFGSTLSLGWPAVTHSFGLSQVFGEQQAKLQQAEYARLAAERAAASGTAPAGGTDPSGTGTAPAAAAGTDAIPPNLIQFGNLLTFISRYIRVLGYSLAVIAFIYAGFLYFTAYGDESKPTKAKQVFIAVIAGLLLIITSEIIIHATLNTVADKSNVNITPYVNDLTTGGNTKPTK